MVLHKIVLKNFKSYKGEHTLGPFDPFSCIVGLNGSGKSNLMDAICFALTVNSSFLRANNLTEVINKDSIDAYVELHLQIHNNKENEYKKYEFNKENGINNSNGINKDNELNKENQINNQNEINNSNTMYNNKIKSQINVQVTTLKRTINAKGISNYFINNKNITHADYLKFLHTINIFPKSKNFLIFQGEIDSISLKEPKEMTNLIEEISESVQFKKEYEEKEEKMDLLFSECQRMHEKRKEVNSRLKEIAENKNQEKKLKAKIKIKEELYAKIKISDLKIKNEEMHKINIKIQNINIQRNELRVQIKEMNTKDDNKNLILMKQMMDIENEIENVMYELNEAHKKDIEYQVGHNNVECLKKNINDMNKILESKLQRKNKLIKEINDLKKLHDGEIEQIDKKNKKFVMNDEIEKKYYELEKIYKKSVREQEEKMNEYKIKIKPNNDRIKMLEENNKDLTKNISNYKRECENLVTEIDKANYKIKMNDASVGIIKNKLKDGINAFQSILIKEKELNDEFGSCIKEILTIKNEQKESERKLQINDCIEYLKLNIDGVYGKIVDLITITQKKYETAISVLMGGFDLAVVVENEKVAIKCIQYVKERKVGRITFLPISSLKNTEIDYNFRKEGIMAIDTVNYDRKIQKAIHFVLGNSLIANDIKEGKNLLYVKKLNLKICTLDGILFHKSGIITGGKVENKFTGDNLSKLLTQKNDIMSQLQNLKIKKSAYSHIEAANEKINILEKENTELLNFIEQEQTKLNFLKERMEKFEATIDKNIFEIKSLKLKSADENIEINNLQLELKKNETKIFKDFVYGKNLKDFKNFIENKDSFKKEKSNEFDKVKKIIENELLSIEIEISDIKRELSEYCNKLDLIQKAGSNENKTNQLKLILDAKNKEFKAKKDVYETAKIKNDENKKNIEKFINKLKILDSDFSELTKKLARLKDSIIGLLKMILMEEIKIPFKEENNTLSKIFSVDMCDDDVIKMLDNVNFENLSESIEFYTTKYNEIVKDIEENMPISKLKDSSKTQSHFGKINSDYEELRKEALLTKEEFNEVKNKRIEKFMACYNVISQSIGDIYRQLTKRDEDEGNAYLLLENNTEPYKEGLKYYAMPPNKRYREMQALSGGEKTMAALALLFSIHAYKPAPFYLFDEMDSALDKMNISSIVEYIANTKVQFIIITLKPSFFQHSDGLVGIYKCSDSSQVLTYRFD